MKSILSGLCSKSVVLLYIGFDLLNLPLAAKFSLWNGYFSMGFVIEFTGDIYKGRLTGSWGYRKSAVWVAGNTGGPGYNPHFSSC